LIICGSKFETKLPLIEKFTNLADKIFVGGALANNFFKEKGFEVGESLLDENADISKIVNNNKIIVPQDVVVESGEVKNTDAVLRGESILDVGDESVNDLIRVAEDSKLIVWNGPLGNYEKGFRSATNKLASALSSMGAEIIVGGGDTISLLGEQGLLDKFSFVSTGGGAMLDFLVNETLPAIEAIKANQKV
jgi:phosphoglycerate kinase